MGCEGLLGDSSTNMFLSRSSDVPAVDRESGKFIMINIDYGF